MPLPDDRQIRREHQLIHAEQRVMGTARPGDAEKWADYCARDNEMKLAWRQAEGHAEFCRLQRLDFYGKLVK